MKALAVSAGIALVAVFVALAAPQPQPFLIKWQDTNSIPLLSSYMETTNNYYLIVGSHNLSTPVDSWPVVNVATNWTFQTNSGGIFYCYTNWTSPATWYFAVVAANFWGTSSPPSNVAQTGPVSTPPANVSISRQ
jgi:hypothetical protein